MDAKASILPTGTVGQGEKKIKVILMFFLCEKFLIMSTAKKAFVMATTFYSYLPLVDLILNTLTAWIITLVGVVCVLTRPSSCASRKP